MWKALVCFLAVVHATHVTYEGYYVIRVIPNTTADLELLREIQMDTTIDFWKPPSGAGIPVDLMLSPQHKAVYKTLQQGGLNPNPYIKDVQRLIEDSQVQSPGLAPGDRTLDTSRYYNLAEIYEWLEEIAEICGSDCELIPTGTSYEGRDLWAIKVGREGEGRASVWIDGGIHAREWISPATVNYIINTLVTEDGVDPEVTALRDAYDWYLQPVVNPDGYDYTWTTDRMWRKTRSPNSGSACMGTDGNRNYDFQWDIPDGASDEPCAQNFRGASPASEAEVQAVQDFVMSISQDTVLSLNFHSFGQILLHSWAYTADDPEDLEDLEAMATICIDAMNAAGDATYTFGRTSARGSGMSMDWSKGAAGIKYSYLPELRDTGEYGFILPPEFIEPQGQEAWAGVKAMAEALLSTH